MNISLTGIAAPINDLYSGFCLVGDREATPKELADYEADKLVKQLKVNTRIELDLTDSVALRCWKANITFPPEWLAYTDALRAIYNGTDKTSAELPNRPSFPTGT